MKIGKFRQVVDYSHMKEDRIEQMRQARLDMPRRSSAEAWAQHDEAVIAALNFQANRHDSAVHADTEGGEEYCSQVLPS